MTDLAVDHDELRPLMFSIAYRMLGSVAEAEDVVQDAFLRIHKAVQRGEVLDVPDAYATTVTTRLAIDTLRSARKQRETYPGTWLPEPLLADDPDPAHRVELDDTVSTAFLVLLERLSPVERAVFLLREVFGYDYAEIAKVVDKSEANCRQLFARAKAHLADERPRFDASTTQRDALAERFFAALRGGDLEAFEQLLAEDVVLAGDGGGKVPAIARPLRGRARCARMLEALARTGARGGAVVRVVEANGQPAARLESAAGELLAVMMLDISGGAVTAVRTQINPDKLQHLGPVGDIRQLIS